jgi:glycosyltransferase 2 family protein
LTAGQVISMLTTVRLAYLLPLPAALGALEASQVLAVTALGLPPVAAISLTLFIRARDVTLAAVGLGLGSKLVQSSKKYCESC